MLVRITFLYSVKHVAIKTEGVRKETENGILVQSDTNRFCISQKSNTANNFTFKETEIRSYKVKIKKKTRHPLNFKFLLQKLSPH